ncbi:MAG: PQQ-binding-like beta-propeller repeat protein, partial [Verrucomicrobiales bacterium]
MKFKLENIALFVALVPALAGPAGAQEPYDRLNFIAEPKPLAGGAVTEDWPRFLGKTDNSVSRETMLLKEWPDGLKPVWEIAKGQGYTAPSFAGGRGVVFHRLGDRETVECIDPESGERFWQYDYEVEFESEIGYSNGPKANAVIDGGTVITCGVTARLHAFELDSGKLIWERDLAGDYMVPDYFFGYGTNPLIWEDRVLVNVGGRDPDHQDGGVCVAAFDAATGKELWTVRDEWGASYASPVMAELHGNPCLLVFAGGKSDPASGGLLTIDPASGKVLDRFPWRAEMVFSANASTPIVVGGNRVFLSECYRDGAVMLEFDPELKSSVVWKQPRFGLHWMQPLVKGNYLYGFAGRNEPDVELVCCQLDTGKIVWRKDLRWSETVGDREMIRSFFRGTLLDVDGSTLCLGEHGALAWLDLSPEGVEVKQRRQLFLAPETWSLPVVYRGLLYITQNDPDRGGG